MNENASERVSQNGYTYVKIDEGKWRLKHHLVAEASLGRPVNTDVERVVFADGDRTNFDPSNITVVAKNKSVSNRTKIARLKKREQSLLDQLDKVRAELKELES